MISADVSAPVPRRRGAARLPELSSRTVAGKAAAAGSRPQLAATTGSYSKRPADRRLALIWRASRLVAASDAGVNNRLRLKFVAHCLIHCRELARLLSAPACSSLAQLIAVRPEMLGIVLWPYISSAWPLAERVGQLVEHCRVIDRLGPPLRRHPDSSLGLLDLRHIHPKATVVLDQPKWFMREGQLVLNLFLGEERMFSLAFDLRGGPSGLEAVVGAVQGRDLPHAQECYKALTKSFFGLRPRDLVFELFRSLCRVLGVVRIVAVADEFRHHRGSYFGGTKQTEFSLNYDAVWMERGGVAAEPGFYQFGVDLPVRDSVPPRKRAMYKRRYDFLEECESAMRTTLARG